MVEYRRHGIDYEFLVFYKVRIISLNPHIEPSEFKISNLLKEQEKKRSKEKNTS